MPMMLSTYLLRFGTQMPVSGPELVGSLTGQQIIEP